MDKPGTVKLLVENGADVNGPHRSGYTPLSIALEKHLEIAQYLLEQGASLTEVDLQKWSQAIHTAFRQCIIDGRIGLISALLDSGFDANQGFAQPGAYRARRVGNMPLETALHVAARAGQLEVAEFLLDNGAECDAADFYKTTPIEAEYFGDTPLLQAARYGKAETVGILLDAGADPNVTG